jgi:hypothetical protein
LGRSTVLSRRGGEGADLTIELDREEDGRWIAEALELPGVLRPDPRPSHQQYGAPAIEVIADGIARGELPSSSLGVSFNIADEHLARQQSEASPRRA